jgi:oligoribonuclease (3'-5' exoribonuclease)
MASATRPHLRTVGSRESVAITSRESALRKIAAICEDQMTEMGLSEEEKNAKTAEFVAFVSQAVTSKFVPDAKQPKPLHSEALQA